MGLGKAGEVPKCQLGEVPKCQMGLGKVARVCVPRALPSAKPLPESPRSSPEATGSTRYATAPSGGTADLRTKTLDFRGFDSSRILILRGGILMSIGNFPERFSRATFVGMILVGRLDVARVRRVAKAARAIAAFPPPPRLLASAQRGPARASRGPGARPRGGSGAGR